jgi:hypothetical protein
LTTDLVAKARGRGRGRARGRGRGARRGGTDAEADEETHTDAEENNAEGAEEHVGTPSIGFSLQLDIVLSLGVFFAIIRRRDLSMNNAEGAEEHVGTPRRRARKSVSYREIAPADDGEEDAEGEDDVERLFLTRPFQRPAWVLVLYA